MNDNIISIIANNNYIILNKSLIKELGLKETIILGELASEYNYYKSNNMLNDGWFYSTVENVKNETSLSDYEQRIAINNLKDKKIISMIIKGIPAKRYIKINTLIIGNLLLNNLRTSSQKIKELDKMTLDQDKFQRNVQKIKNTIKTKESSYNIEEFDSSLFDSIVDYAIIGGYDEEGNANPFLIRFICRNGFYLKSRDDISDEMIINNGLNNKDNIYIPILDFISTQKFVVFEEEGGRRKKKIIDKVRVRVELEK